MPDMVEVTQADRDAAADLIEAYWHDSDAGMMKLARSYREGHSQGVFVRAFARHRIAALTTPSDRASGQGDGWQVETVRDIDVPKGAWDWIEALAVKAEPPHRRIETPRDAETIVFWHNERAVAFVLNIRDQFNRSVQFRAALATAPSDVVPGEQEIG